MEYFSQADHDGLCGFYAVLNGLAYLSPHTGMKEPLTARTDRQDFFDSAVECLARVPGITVRVVKGVGGGLDQFQIAELYKIVIAMRALPVSVERRGPLHTQALTHRYEDLASHPVPFALLVPVAGGSHWVTIVRGEEQGTYGLIDNNPLENVKLGSGQRFDPHEAIILRYDRAAPASW